MFVFPANLRYLKAVDGLVRDGMSGCSFQRIGYYRW